MRSYFKYSILIILVLIYCIGAVSADDLEDMALNHEDEINGENASNVLTDFNDVMIGESEEITVNDWDDLQYYCSQNDKNYVLKLKENTNYYPTNPNDESYQIQVNNNVTILGSSGAYFGDTSPNARSINFLAINVPENSGYGITLKGITFKWISTEYQPNAVFLQMAGNAKNTIQDCIFTNSTLTGGHSSFVYLLRGDVTLTNCSFTNITSDYGCLSLYDSKDDPTDICTHARGEVVNSYFEGNYARTEPGCINNCGVLVVRNSTFYKNAAFWWAGAIHTHGGANTTIYDSNFTDNIAGWNGGALYTYSYLQIYNTIFVGNNCTTNNGGGAIGACKYLHSPYIHIENSLFEDNENLCWAFTNESTTGLGRGGAISIMDEGELTVLNSSFIKNSASIGTAICAISQGSLYGSPDVTIRGNRFINHTRVDDVLVIKVDYNSKCDISDNYYLNNSIVFSKLKLTADERVGDEVTLHIDASLKNKNFYDSDILERSDYDVFVDGKYFMTVNSTTFALNLKNIEKAQVYIVPSISTVKSNEVSVGMPKEYIYVSQKYGKDSNNGSKDTPVATISKAIELASSTENIHILDGTFNEKNLNIDYNLTITCDDNVIINSKGTIFNISNVDVEIKNLIFKNNKQASSASERIIKQTSGILSMSDCTFESNSYNALIETGGLVEFNNLKFINNVGILIQADNYVIASSLFDSNVATVKSKSSTLIKSNSGFKCSILNSTFLNNQVMDGCIYFAATNNKQNTLTIKESSFINNTGNEGSSGIYMYNNGVLDIKSSLFLNNTDSGKNGALILTSAEAHIADSIFLGNIFDNSNNVLFNSKSAINLKNIYCSGNWFGNTVNDYNVTPPISSSSNCDNWMFLNVSANTTSLFQGESAIVNFNLNNVYTKEGNVTYWDSSNLPDIKLVISTIGGTSEDKKLNIVYGLAKTKYTLNDVEGSLIASYNGVNAVINFIEAKINPEMTVTFNNISVDDDEIITVMLPDNATGNLTLTLGNISENMEVKGSNTVFTLSNLPYGLYDGDVTYSGDEYYALTKKTIRFNVDRYDSNTKLAVGQIDVGSDVILTVTVSPSVTGNVTLIINNKEETLVLVNSKVTYTITAITRGDYNIKAIYNGNYKYSSSNDTAYFSVDKLNATISASVNDIVYGQDAKIEIELNSDATGNVTVYINGENNTANLENGKATLNVSSLNAGNKEVFIDYPGDNVFNPINYTTSFNVAKANTTLTINVNDIMIGQDENIEITLLSGVDGNITIVCEEYSVVKSIPRTGKVTWKLSELPIKEYTVIASLSSENYNFVENNVRFTVSDYETPQWPNEGYDIQNSGKSDYDVNSNGEILWNIASNGEIIGNLAIDSEGNIYFVTAEGVSSMDNAGNLLWTYNNSNQGNISGIAIGRDIIVAPEAGNSIYFINQTSGERFGNSNIYQGSSLFSPVIDSNANVYISSEYQHASEDYKLVIIPYKIWEKGGNPILISLGKSDPNAAPVIVNDKIAVVACKDSLKIINLETKSIVSSIKGNNNGIRPIVGSGNLIYAILDDSIAEITIQGNVLWKTKVTDGVGEYMALDDEQGVYHVNSKGILYRYDLLSGEEIKMTDLNVTSGILIDNEGILYFGCDNEFYAMDNEARILWKSDIGSQAIGNPIVDKNGIIYITSADKVFALTYHDLKDANLFVNVDDVNYGEDAVIKITIDSQATGSLVLNVNGESYDMAFENATKVLSNLNAGNYDVEIIYSGDARFKGKTIVSNFTVKRLDSNLNVSADNITVGQDLTVNVLLDMNATGNVTVLVDDKSKTVIIKNSEAFAVISGLTAGNKTVNVLYSGDINFNNASTSIDIEVKHLMPDFSVSIPSSAKVGEKPLVTVELPNDATGSVVLIFDGNQIDNTSVKDGSTNFTLNNLPVGEHTVEVVYSGDDKYSCASDSSTINVTPETKKDSNLSVTVGDVYYGEDAVIQITIDSQATGNLTIKVDGKSYDLACGNVNKSISNLNAGNYDVEVEYGGDSKFYGKNALSNFTVKKSEPNLNVGICNITFGQDLIVNVSLCNDASGSVVLVLDGNQVDNASLVDGKTSFTLNNLTVGEHSVEVVYSGDKNYAPANDSSTINVAPKIKKDTVIVVDSTFTRLATDYYAGERGAFFYAILQDLDGNPLENKTVQIAINGPVYEITTDKMGRAGLQINLAAANTYTYALFFQGDSDYKASPLASSKLTVTKKSTSITASAKTFKASAKTKTVSVTLNTVKNPYDGKTYLRSGKALTLTVNGKTYNAKTNNKGVASFNIQITKVGTYTAKVSFAGDNTYNACTKSFKIYIKNTVSAAETKLNNPTATEILDNGNLNDNPSNSNVNSNASIAVSDEISTHIEVQATFSRVANDYSAGERGAMFYAVLKDINGNPLANKTVQIAINGPIYNVTTDSQGRAGLQVNLAYANTYTYALAFGGDDQYAAAKIASSKLTVTKKSTSITASAKTFKASAKTKTVSVTLNTIKNPYDGKTYLKSGKTLTLTVNGKTYTAKTNSKGVASFNIQITKTGKYTAKVNFAGDNTYAASTKSTTITIK